MKWPFKQLLKTIECILMVFARPSKGLLEALKTHLKCIYWVVEKTNAGDIREGSVALAASGAAAMMPVGDAEPGVGVSNAVCELVRNATGLSKAQRRRRRRGAKVIDGELEVSRSLSCTAQVDGQRPAGLGNEPELVFIGTRGRKQSRAARLRRQRYRCHCEERLEELRGESIREARQLVRDICLEEIRQLEEYLCLERHVGRPSRRRRRLAWVLWLGYR